MSTAASDQERSQHRSRRLFTLGGIGLAILVLVSTFFVWAYLDRGGKNEQSSGSSLLTSDTEVQTQVASGDAGAAILRMREHLDTTGSFDEQLRGEARYRKHRLFQTSARIVGNEW